MTLDNASDRLKRVRSKNTTPEVRVRKALHKMGLRFRLHRADLPGKPDIVLAKHQTVLFVHGCFWHRHAHCPKTQMPKRNDGFWQRKFTRNVVRDAANQMALQDMGWRVAVIWECETKSPDALIHHLQAMFTPLMCDTSSVD